MLYFLIELNPHKDITLHVSIKNPAVVRLPLCSPVLSGRLVVCSPVHLVVCLSVCPFGSQRIPGSWLVLSSFSIRVIWVIGCYRGLGHMVPFGSSYSRERAHTYTQLLYDRFGFKAEEFIVGFYEDYMDSQSQASKNAFRLRLRQS